MQDSKSEHLAGHQADIIAWCQFEFGRYHKSSESKMDLTAWQWSRQLTFDEISGLAGTRKFNEQVLKYYRTRAIGRKSTLIFAKDLKYVDNLTTVFVDAGIPAKSVTSRTSKTSRQEYIASFARGDCPVLVTCLALSEGFDAPQVSTNHGFERISRADIDRSTASSWQIPPTPGSFIPRW
jgi:superfamily II DNA or RNA helicase